MAIRVIIDERNGLIEYLWFLTQHHLTQINNLTNKSFCKKKKGTKNFLNSGHFAKKENKIFWKWTMVFWDLNLSRLESRNIFSLE